MNWGYPDTAEATCRALAAIGYRVEVPAVQCCGMPHRAYGDEEAARRLARRNLEVLAGYEAVITDCASCGAALKGYGELLAGEGATTEQAQAVAGKVSDISQFLVRQGLPALREGAPLRVTYHEPCHLGREQGVRAEPRQLLRALPGIEYVEMPGADVCCGGAGSFCITHAALSRQVGEAKLANILATGASVVASGCPSCITQLRAMARRLGAPVAVVHPTELLLRHLVVPARIAP
jgi:glycolate oxidase iron-sulfur subunit